MSKVVKLTPQNNGGVEFLVLSKLQVDRRYQRDIDPNRIKTIADKWDPAKAKPPIVSRRKDGDYIIDGQHTAFAAIQANGEKYAHACIVYSSLTPQREAEIFDGQNENVRRLTRVDLYKSRVFRREPTATAIDSIVIAAGLRVAPQAGSNNITAVAALERVYRAHKNLDETLRLLRGWGTSRGGVFNGNLIKSVGAFLARYPNADKGRMLQKMKEMTPTELLAQISVKQETDRLKVEVCGAMVLRAMYNHRLTKGTLPRFNDQVD